MDISRINFISNSNISKKTVLLRVDLNLPFEKDKVTDNLRIDRILETINLLQERKCKVIIISHLGRPLGKIDKNFSLLRTLKPLSDKLRNQNIKFSNDCIGQEAINTVIELNFGEICLFENLRFYKEEEMNDITFAKKLSKLGDIFVNEAFSCCHRKHSSIVSIPKFLPSFAGVGLQKEITKISEVLETPKRPLMVIIGGSKISTKINTLLNIVKKADTIAIGGAMANTFLAAQNFEIGNSLSEKNMIKNALEIIKIAKKNKCELILPSDVITANRLEHGSKTKMFDVKEVPNDEMIFDIGEKSISYLISKIKISKSLLWNGPLGAFEFEPFDFSTTKISQEVAKLTSQNKILSVAGGGDTVAALTKAKVKNEFSYLSTAGGAFLEWLDGKELPGILALRKA